MIDRIQRPSSLGLVWRGALAGAAATVVMSAVMLAAKRVGVMPQTPPEEIVEEGLEEVDAPATEEQSDVAAGIAHIGFGALGGATFAPVAAGLAGAPPVLLAVPWALAIWLVSYFGWIPALRILPAPTEDDPGRAWTMLGAHLVYGLALGILWRTAARSGRLR